MTRAAAEFDVMVAGGGPAGICAAVQAAGAGARTLLVEKTGSLGGTTVNAGVDIPGLFHAWGRQVIAGVGWDLVRRTVEATDPASMPDFTQDVGGEHWRHQVRVDRTIFAALADQTVRDAGATLLLHGMIAAAAPAGGGWEVTLCLKEGLANFRASVLIDCTGDANVFAVAGLARERNVELQPATLVCQADGYDPSGLDYDAINRAIASAVASGRLLRSDFGWGSDPARWWLRGKGGSRIHVVGVDGSTSAGRTEAEVQGRAVLLRLFRFFREQPGLGGFRYRWTAAECGIRESWTIVGREKVTREDYVGGRVWPDALCYSYYPIDIHTGGGTGLDLCRIPRGIVPTIPRGAMVPPGDARIVAAGRCICADRAALSAARAQASCMAMGQAAGAIAALAVRAGCGVADVPIADARDLLRAHGAIVPAGA
ncbi:MAG: hypothetical protein BIFFINMI_02186 [Phycisphaerae bacterium]|nr:hypothetical protein [Phycisphaerae bacterium]